MSSRSRSTESKGETYSRSASLEGRSHAPSKKSSWKRNKWLQVWPGRGGRLSDHTTLLSTIQTTKPVQGSEPFPKLSDDDSSSLNESTREITTEQPQTRQGSTRRTTRQLSTQRTSSKKSKQRQTQSMRPPPIALEQSRHEENLLLTTLADRVDKPTARTMQDELTYRASQKRVSAPTVGVSLQDLDEETPIIVPAAAKVTARMICQYVLALAFVEMLVGSIGALCFFHIFGKHGVGLSWRLDAERQINLHFFLMVVGFVILSTQAILADHLFAFMRENWIDTTRWTLFFAGFICVAVGFYVGYNANETLHGIHSTANTTGTTTDLIGAHLYSLHAWVAVLSIGLVSLEVFFELITICVHLCCNPLVIIVCKAALAPACTGFKVAVQTCAFATIITGLLQLSRHQAVIQSQGVISDEAQYKHNQLFDAMVLLVIILMVTIPLAVRLKLGGSSGHQKVDFTSSGPPTLTP